MERKPRIYRYYAMKDINSVVIRRSFTPISRVRCTVTIPKMPNSPNYLDDGSINTGVKISQVCYTGGEIVAILPLQLFEQKVVSLRHVTQGHCIRLTPDLKKIVKELLAIK